MTKRERDGWVYFMGCKKLNLIKIGWSTHPESRAVTINSAGPNEVALLTGIKGTKADERAMHDEFAALRVKGEWFRAAPELVERVVYIAKRQGYAPWSADNHFPESELRGVTTL